MNASIPASYIFSYWIFAWAFIYILAVWIFHSSPPKWLQWFNPTLALMTAFIWTSISVIRLCADGASWKIIAKYTSTIVAIKAIPLWFIYYKNYPFNWNIHTMRDSMVLFGIFLLYSGYLWLHGTSYDKVYDDLTDSIKRDENRTPFESIMNKLFNI